MNVGGQRKFDLILLKKHTTDRQIKCHPFFSFVVIKKEWNKIGGNLFKNHIKSRNFCRNRSSMDRSNMRHKRSAL